MTTATITKIKNDEIILPREIRKSWEGSEVYIDFSKDRIFIKRLTKPALNLKQMMDECRKSRLHNFRRQAPAHT